MGVRGEVFSTKVSLQNRTYFFNVKENRLGDLYLNMVESRNRDEGGFERQSLILFAEDIQEFLQGFDESLKVMEKAVREKRQGRKAAPPRRERDDAFTERKAASPRRERDGERRERKGFTEERRGRPASDSAKWEGPKREGPKRDSFSRDSVRRELPKREGFKRDSPKREGPRREGAKWDGPRRDGPKREAPKRERPSRDTGRSKFGSKGPESAARKRKVVVKKK